MISTDDILKKYGRDEVAGRRSQVAGLGNSIKNQGVFDTHDFSWKGVYFGGFEW